MVASSLIDVTFIKGLLEQLYLKNIGVVGISGIFLGLFYERKISPIKLLSHFLLSISSGHA